jgi:hypothetical protein
MPIKKLTISEIKAQHTEAKPYNNFFDRDRMKRRGQLLRHFKVKGFQDTKTGQVFYRISALEIDSETGEIGQTIRFFAPNQPERIFTRPPFEPEDATFQVLMKYYELAD